MSRASLKRRASEPPLATDRGIEDECCIAKSRREEPSVARTKRMNGDGSVRRRPDGRYEARVLLRDGQRISVYGKTAREVTREIRTIKVKHDVGAPIVRNEQKLGPFLEDWLAREIKRRRRAKTYASYAQMVRGHMLRELGPIKL